jgi:DNA modification methylase
MSKPKRQPAPDLSYIAEDLRPFAVPIGSLVLDPKNARLHNEPNLASIKASLSGRGQRKPITVRRDGSIVMTGNGTVETAKALGWTHIAALFFDDDAAEAAAWAIADNRSAELATWDYRQLGETMAAFPEVDWLAVGHEANELEAILAHAAVVEIPSEPETTTVGEHERELPSDGPDDDEVPPTPSEPRTKFGEVIRIGRHTLHCLDCMDLLRSLPDNSIDAIVTDPPYGLSPDGRARTWDDIEALRREGKGPKSGFMGSAWDAGVPGISWARECLRVLKPGGYLVAFSATRTIHRLTTAAEDAGFEIIDQLGWLQWEGMPHGMNISLAIDKAAGAEREVIGGRGYSSPDFGEEQFRQQGSMMLTHEKAGRVDVPITAPTTDLAKLWHDYHTRLKPCAEPILLAQKPCEGTVVENVAKWGTGGLNIGATRHPEGCAAWPGPNEPWGTRHNNATSGAGSGNGSEVYGKMGAVDGAWNPAGRFTGNVFQYPKPSKREKTEGTDETHERHTTVKPKAAMRRLIRLVLPPSGGRVLEPFGGSGTTIVAACDLDCEVIASEMSPAYCDIIRARVEARLARAALP